VLDWAVADILAMLDWNRHTSVVCVWITTARKIRKSPKVAQALAAANCVAAVKVVKMTTEGHDEMRRCSVACLPFVRLERL